MAQEAFATRLREAMNEKGLKQVDLLRYAESHGHKLGKSQLSQYLSGKTMPRPDKLANLATALGVTVEWLSGDAEIELAQPATAASSTSTIQEAPMALRKFNKSSKLDNVSYDVRGPALDEAMRMEEDGITILKLNIGNPAPFGFRTPD
ncbi:MAG: helix-turn-helix domain-containing protein, partial [Atopobiaceae bacterium]|nr:helix-turn-helix domain-containing protein [Atopobiaceae bacterium]